MNVETILESVREIPEGRRYWFVRTYDGALYDTFIDNGYIGIGMNPIPMEYIKKAKPGEGSNVQQLYDFISNNYNYKGGSATRFMHQVIDFVYNIKAGDIVVVPNKDSHYLAIGEVVSTEIYQKNVNGTFYFENKQEPFPEKRKKVKWMKTVSRHQFINEIGKPFVVRTVLADMSIFGEFIESYISSFYIKNQRAYLALTIGQEEDINAFHLHRLLESLTYFYKEFAIEFNEDHAEELYLKIKVQSKGKAILKGVAVFAVGALAGLTLLSNNPNVDIKYKDLEIGFGSDGFLESLSDFLDRKQERLQQQQVFQDSLQALKVNQKTGNSIEENAPDDAGEEGEENNGENDGNN